MYQVEVARKAVKFLKSQTKPVRSQIWNALRSLSANPRPTGYEKMKSETERYRIRVGDYRIIYTIQDDKLLVLVLKIGHRKDIYRRR